MPVNARAEFIGCTDLSVAECVSAYASGATALLVP
jgi:hypothetical protein